MKNILRFLFHFFSVILLTGCRTITPSYDYGELARASLRLGIEIEMKDNHALYVESSQWLGVPYLSGGISKKGVDCSGLTSAIYKKVYRQDLERNANDQRKKNCRKIKKKKLKEGDLVFFHNGRRNKTATHVGIYLKERKFIHASTSQGVVISTLDDKYWKEYWLSGGRP